MIIIHGELIYARRWPPFSRRADRHAPRNSAIHREKGAAPFAMMAIVAA
jgi:hypothetical protein